MIYLTLKEALELYEGVINSSGGSFGVRDLGLLNSALAQPRQTFGGIDLYPTLEDKTSILIFSVVNNHPFVDGNKRAGQVIMERFLTINGFEISSTVDEQEQIILQLASGGMSREELAVWLKSHIVEKGK